MIVANVFDSGEGKGEALGKLDAANHGKGNESVEKRHETGGTEEEEGGGCAHAGCGDLGLGEVGRLGDGDCGDGLHGLHGHGKAEEKASRDVVEGSED